VGSHGWCKPDCKVNAQVNAKVNIQSHEKTRSLPDRIRWRGRGQWSAPHRRLKDGSG